LSSVDVPVHADLLWMQKRVKQLKPLVRNMLGDKIEADVLCYLQGVDDDLDLYLDVSGTLTME
jgi:hypothetical protein